MRWAVCSQKGVWAGCAFGDMLAQVMKCSAAGSIHSSGAIRPNVDGFRTEVPPHPSVQLHTSVHVTLHDGELGFSVKSASSYLAGVW